MTPEIKLIDDYNAWLNAFLESGEFENKEKFESGLRPYITDETVLNEPESLPWGVPMVGYAGWSTFIRHSTPIFAHFAGRYAMSTPVYYQNGSVVLREFTVTISGSPAVPEPFVMKLIERYTVENERISQLDEFYSDTAAFLDYLALEGVISK